MDKKISEFPKICGELFALFASAPHDFDKKTALRLLLKLAEIYAIDTLKTE